MSSRKKWRIVAPILALVLIFVAIMLIAGEQLGPVNMISIIIVASIMIYFIYLASSLKK